MPAAPAVPFLILVLISFTGKRPRAPQQNPGHFPHLSAVAYFYVAFSSLQATCVSCIKLCSKARTLSYFLHFLNDS